MTGEVIVAVGISLWPMALRCVARLHLEPTYLANSGFTEQNELHTTTRFWCRSCGLGHAFFWYFLVFVEFGRSRR